MIKALLDFIFKRTAQEKSSKENKKNPKPITTSNPYIINQSDNTRFHLALDQPKIGGKPVINNNYPKSYGTIG